jgi:hypothetical protein
MYQIAFARSLQAYLHLLSLAKDYADLLAITETIPYDKRRKFTRYSEKHLNWLIRDLRSDFKSSEDAAAVLGEMDSDWGKSLSRWLELGLQTKNLEEVMNTLELCKAKPKPIPEDHDPDDPGVPLT